VLPWRDVLHEGPVPAGLDPAELRDVRAGFLAEAGWAERDAARADMAARDDRLDAAIDGGEEIVLWFETDLYDILQLAQVLERVPAGRARLILTGEREFRGVAELGADGVRDLLAGGDAGGHRRSLTVAEDVTAAARDLWAALRAADAGALAPLAAGTPPLPALGQAARRHQQQYPWRGSGINRTERALLEAVAGGARSPADAFVAQQQGEERPFMGDATAFAYLRALASGPDPLLDEGEGLRLTAHGRAVLDGERGWAQRPERWLGGVRLPAGAPPWEYDPAEERLVARG
jgi:hypothetical protein